MRLYNPFTRHKSEIPEKVKNVIFAFVLLANAAAVAIFIVNKMGSYPIGWDAPYYITRVRYFEELGVLSNRAGFISLMSTLHAVLGISLYSLHLFFTVGVITLLSGASAFLASRLFSDRRLAFLLTFVSVSWYTPYFALSASTFDNALGLFFMLSALIFFSGPRDGWKSVTLFSLAATMTLLTHLESYLLLLFILAIYAVWASVRERSVRIFFIKYRPYIVSVILTVLLALIQWSDVISPIFSQYANPVDQSLNASIPYSQSRSFQEFVKLLSTGIPNILYGATFVIGVCVAFAFRATGSKKRAVTILLAYVLGAYALLLYSVVRSSIPINRSVLILPVPLFVGIGITYLLDYFSRRLRVQAISTLGMVFMLIIFPVAAFRLYVDRFPLAITPEVYHDLVDLRDYVVDRNVTHFVLVTNTDPYTTAASAYYGLWSNWVKAMFPLDDENRSFCIYFGTLANYPQRVPTVRGSNPEYNETNVESLSCVKKLPENAGVFMITGLYAGNIPSTSSVLTVKNISTRVMQLTFPEATAGTR